mgnify:FL=1
MNNEIKSTEKQLKAFYALVIALRGEKPTMAQIDKFKSLKIEEAADIIGVLNMVSKKPLVQKATSSEVV